ncbi:MAG: hypothetical protein KDI13_00885 [Alphaproteobacteria bacterium]|nr:hypothetical protein [Alphaproteobacteria bacterium]
MSYKDFYDHCQTLTPKVRRNDLMAKALEINGIPKIQTRKTDLNTKVCRGFYLSARNIEHPFVKQHGCHLIVLPREGLNVCEERFVWVKELMHVFDDPKEATDTGENFERVLNELQPGAMERSLQTMSEIRSFWMALAALCPESARIQFEKDRSAGHVNDYGIALKLRIPKQYVPLLFGDRFINIRNQLLK